MVGRFVEARINFFDASILTSQRALIEFKVTNDTAGQPLKVLTVSKTIELENTLYHPI